MIAMDLLPWFLKIPGHDQNVRIPSAPSSPVLLEDTIATSEPPQDSFGWMSAGPMTQWEKQPELFDYYLDDGGGVPIPGGEYGVTNDEALAIAWASTGKAAMQGALIASIDGPIPIMDIFGFAWASYKTVEAWEEYRRTTQ